MDNQKIKDSFSLYLKECPDVKTTIHWYNLYEGHYVELDKDFQKELFEKAVNKAGNYSELGRLLDTARKTLSNCSKGKTSTQIKVLKKITDYIDHPLENFNNKIIEIAGLKPNLPFRLHNKEGAEIRAAFLSDGHIDKHQTSPAQYCAYEIELHERLIDLCKKIFGEFKTKTYFNSRSHITKFPAVIGRALELSGLPRGDKRLANSYLPKDILVSNKEVQTSYLRRVFDDEGDVCFDKSGKRAVRITRSVNINHLKIDIPSERWIRFQLPIYFRQNLLLGEQLLLLQLGIYSRLYPEGIYRSRNGNLTAKWRIQIARQDQLRRFSELINFNLTDKQNKLKDALKSYKLNERPNGEGDKHAYEFLMKVYKEKGFFKFGDLGKELVKIDRSYDLAGKYLANLARKGLIKKIKRGVYTFDTN